MLLTDVHGKRHKSELNSTPAELLPVPSCGLGQWWLCPSSKPIPGLGQGPELAIRGEG